MLNPSGNDQVFYCPVHQLRFRATGGAVIKCEQGGHPVGFGFPEKSWWEYCCDCGTFWPFEPGNGRLGRSECLVCDRPTAKRHLCDKCQVVCIESSVLVRRKTHFIDSEGRIKPSCPGCASQAVAKIVEHNCAETTISFLTARDDCPFCANPIQAQSTPAVSLEFCPFCGTEQQASNRFCKRCGKAQPQGRQLPAPRANVEVVRRSGVDLERLEAEARLRLEGLERAAESERLRLEQEQAAEAERLRAEQERAALASPPKKKRAPKKPRGRSGQEQVGETERLERERAAEAERLEQERAAEAERLRLEQERAAEAERLEQERLAEIEWRRLEQEQAAEAERLEQERAAEAERLRSESELAVQEAQRVNEEATRDPEEPDLAIPAWTREDLPAELQFDGGEVEPAWNPFDGLEPSKDRQDISVLPCEAALDGFEVRKIVPTTAPEEITASQAAGVEVSKSPPPFDQSTSAPVIQDVVSEAQGSGPSWAVTTEPVPKRRTQWVIAASGVVASLAAVLAIAMWLSRQPATDGSPKPSPSPAIVAPENMVYIPGGEFVMGSDAGDEYEKPAHKVTVKPFFIDRYEVTCEEYEEFVKATGHKLPANWVNGTYPAGAARMPVTGVDWDDAYAYVHWAKRRLPGEAEWEFAARGSEGWSYPWGNDWKQGLANANKASLGLAEVGQFKGRSPFGIADMIGNAWEWTADPIHSYSGGKIAEDHFAEVERNKMKIIRGGCFLSSPNQATATYRRGWPPLNGPYEFNQTGFRSALDSPNKN